MKPIILLVFYASVIGMCLSWLLASPRAREFLAAVWVQVSLKIEQGDIPNPADLTLKLIAPIYLDSNGSVSLTKTLRIAVIAALVGILPYHLILGGNIDIDGTISRFSWLRGSLRALVSAIPLHWLTEFVGAFLLHRAIKKAASENYIKGLLRVAVMMVLIIVAIYLCMFIYTLWLYTLSDFPTAFVFFSPAVVITNFRIEGLSLGTTVLAFQILASIIFAAMLLIYAMSLALLVNQHTFKSVQVLTDSLSAQDSKRLFNASLIAFTLSTGYMQYASYV